MALVEVNTPAFDFARGVAVQASPQKTRHQAALPLDALTRLSFLRDEAGQDLRLARFLARAPLACTVLLIAGAMMALSSTSGLMIEFAWAAMLLGGIVAITANHMRHFAVAQPRLSLRAAASQLRHSLLYTGLAWSSGAFLVLPGQPAPVLVLAFALAPAGLIGLILKDRKGSAAFAAPVALVTVMTANLAGWPQALWIGAAILAALPGVILLPALQQEP